MRFGTFHLHSVPPWANSYDVVQQQFDQIVLADRIGLDEVWLAEHNARTYGAVGNVLTTASAAAAATNRVRIGTAVTRLPLHHPLHLAEDLAYVDILSGGRLDWGVGKGYDPLEFGTYGVPFEEREDRWQDTFDTVLSIWRSGRTGAKSRFVDLEDAELFPPPLQRPTPPVYYMVSRSDSSVVWAAERLYPMVLGQGPSWDDVKHKLELYRTTALEAGYEESEVKETLRRAWQLKQVHVAGTTKQAIEECREGLMWYFDQKNNRIMFGYPADPHPYEWYVSHRSVILGSPEKVINDLGEYAEYTGMPNVIAWISCGGQPHGQVETAMRRFADEVVPPLRGVAAGSR
jgi:alkanesulfonate monooxygenase SsuD/methylene tetrahydromethanopterin reductase-like flavin-dependent oxidoreductase (luciferase family)